MVPRSDDLRGYTAEDVGTCFVQYETAEAAAAAHRTLHNRDFDGNTVKATFLPDA